MKAGRADFVVVVPELFGVWTAHFLRRRGYTVTVLDAHRRRNTQIKLRR